MKKIGMIYATDTAKTANVAKKIIAAFGETNIDVIPVEEAKKEDFETYDLLIIGSSTWFDGELPSYWDELLPAIKLLDLKNKKVAIFGLGDQKKYPENFADSVGILSYVFEKCGANIVGKTSTEGYTFEYSIAVKNGQLQGLVVDVENQQSLIDDKVKDWVEQLKIEFFNIK